MKNPSKNKICDKENHNLELKYFCKTHNMLCCSNCKKESGNHYKCDINDINEIKDSKLNELKKYLIILEDFTNPSNNKINNLKKLFDKKNMEKEYLKIEVQKMCTKIRNKLNNREDLLLYKIDKIFNDLYFDEKLMRDIEKLPKKSQKNLEKGKLINEKGNSINEENNNLITIISDCIDIENNIKEIEEFNKLIKKCNDSNEFKLRLYPTSENLQSLFNEINNLRIESTISLKYMKELTLLHSNEKILIEGNLENTIKVIKSRISQNIPPEKINILDCYGNILKDDNSFNYHAFYLDVDYNINVTIRYQGNRKITFNNLKINGSLEYIENELDYNYYLQIYKSKQRFFYKGNEIKSSFDLIKAIEKNDIEMDLYIGPKDGLLIDIKKKSGEVYKYSLKSDTKIKNIELFNLLELPLDSYNLSFNGRILDKEKTLKDNNINDKSTLDFNWISKTGNVIIIRRTWFKKEGIYKNYTLFNVSFPFEVDFSETILSIKKKYSEKDLHLPIENQSLVYNNIRLEDNKSLKEYNIKNDEIIDIVYKFQIIVETLIKKVFILNIDFYYTIKDIKDLIYKNEGIPQSEQRLFYLGRGSLLENELTVLDYGIRENSKLLLFLRLRGNPG